MQFQGPEVLEGGGLTVSGQDERATAQTAVAIITAGPAHTFAHVTVEGIKQRRSAQPGEGRGQPLEMLAGLDTRVVETREPATETTLEDVLARNLSTHGAMHAHQRGVCHPVLPVLLVHCSTLPN